VEAGGHPSLNEVVGAVPVGGGAGHAGHFTGGAGHAGHLTGIAGHAGSMGGGGHAGHFTNGAGPAFHPHVGAPNPGHLGVNMVSAGLSTRGGHGHQHQQNLANQLEAIRENIKVKNETMGDMRKVLLEKMLLDNMATLTYEANLMQLEKDFRRAELSCKEALLN